MYGIEVFSVPVVLSRGFIAKIWRSVMKFVSDTLLMFGLVLCLTLGSVGVAHAGFSGRCNFKSGACVPAGDGCPTASPLCDLISGSLTSCTCGV